MTELTILKTIFDLGIHLTTRVVDRHVVEFEVRRVALEFAEDIPILLAGDIHDVLVAIRQMAIEIQAKHGIWVGGRNFYAQISYLTRECQRDFGASGLARLRSSARPAAEAALPSELEDLWHEKTQCLREAVRTLFDGSFRGTKKV